MLRFIFTGLSVFIIELTFGQGLCLPNMANDLEKNYFDIASKRINESVKKLTLFEPHFRRNFIHIRDVVLAVIYSIKNFDRLKNNVYNLGLSSANITKLDLAKKIKKEISNLVIKIEENKKDPDQRDYFVSNKKIEETGWKPIFTLDDGIQELIQSYKMIVPTQSQYRNTTPLSYEE